MNNTPEMPKPLECRKCGKNWYPKLINGKPHIPTICPQCKTKYWNCPPPQRPSIKWRRYNRY